MSYRSSRISSELLEREPQILNTPLPCNIQIACIHISPTVSSFANFIISPYVSMDGLSVHTMRASVWGEGTSHSGAQV